MIVEIYFFVFKCLSCHFTLYVGNETPHVGKIVNQLI